MNEQIAVETIVAEKTYFIRGQRIMLDFDIAGMFEVDTKVIRRTVTKNPKRFPPDFIFFLTAAEWEVLKKQIGTAAAQSLKQLPYAFTEAGVLMLSGQIKSEVAVKVSIRLIEALFVYSK